MNDLVTADLFDIVPSIDLPCCRLPFGIHQNVCSALDPEDRWMTLAADPRLELNSDAVTWLDNVNRNEGSCTTALLEQLWINKRTTVGKFLEVLESKEQQLTKDLRKYLKGCVSEEECTQSTSAYRLMNDPRTPVS